MNPANAPLDPAQVPAAVPIPHSRWMTIIQGLAFALSAILSPYLVIPIGTIGVVYSISERRTFVLWTALSIFFSTVVPALYVVVQVMRGKITDVHVMEREQRGGPFMVAIASSALGSLALWALDAPVQVWGIGLVLAVNGAILTAITAYWKISMHVSVLSATILAALMIVPGLHWLQVGWMVPALIWARVTRKRHTLGQGIGAVVVSCLVTGIVLNSVFKLAPPNPHGILPSVRQKTNR